MSTELESLLRDTALWLTTDWFGLVVLVIALLLLTVMFTAPFGLADDA